MKTAIVIIMFATLPACSSWMYRALESSAVWAGADGYSASAISFISVVAIYYVALMTVVMRDWGRQPKGTASR